VPVIPSSTQASRPGDPGGTRGWQGIGDHDTAIIHCRRAIPLGRASLGGHDETLPWPLTILATSLNHLGRVDEAIACRQEAAAIYTDRRVDANAATMRQHLRTTDHLPSARTVDSNGSRDSAQ